MNFWDLSLIRLFDFYLALLFLASVVRRLDLYRSVMGLVVNVPGRWPRLMQLVREHRMTFMTWPLLGPAILALGLLVLQLIASRLIWPEAARPPHGLTPSDLAEHWPALAVALPLGLAMVGVDLYFIVAVGRVDRQMLEGYFDQAEYWLKSKTAHVVKIVTFGYVNPREMVATEVRKALHEASKMLATNFKWMSLQLGLRVAFGLSLWLTWALTG